MVSGGWVGVWGPRGEEGVTAALAGARAPTPRPPRRAREGTRGPGGPGGSRFLLLRSLSPGRGAGLPEDEESWVLRGLKRGWGRRECCRRRKRRPPPSRAHTRSGLSGLGRRRPASHLSLPAWPLERLRDFPDWAPRLDSPRPCSFRG